MADKAARDIQALNLRDRSDDSERRDEVRQAPAFPIPRAVGHTNGTQNSPSHLRRTESESALNFFPRPAPLPRRCTRRCA